MGGTEQALTGPDLKKGVATDSLKPGEKLIGHADGSPVLLIRDKDNFYAMSARCSHYSAPLEDGLVVGETVRCPWHHACFNYKTGEVTKAPALNSLATWKTEVKNGKVYVSEKREAEALKVAVSGHEHFVIVGSGAAGHAAAEKLRRLGFHGKVTILTADTDLPYDRPNLSKDYLAGNAPEEWMPLRPAEFFQEQKIDLRVKAKVTKLDSKQKLLTLADGSTINYHKCLIATGGVPVKPAIVGIDQPHVHFLRSFSDCRSLITDLKDKKQVVIVGAGFIGLEAAAAFKTRGLKVTVVAPGENPLEHVVGREVGAFLKSVHEQNGIQFRMGRSVEKIEKKGVILNDKSVEPADLVLVATGIKPMAEFAQADGVRFDNGILVNEYLESSAKDVFAAGDVARWPSPFAKDPIRIEHWVVAQRQGQVAAANMMGRKQKYSEVPFFWSQQFDVMLNYVGYGTTASRSKVYGDLGSRNCAVAYSEGDTVKAVLTLGRDLQSLELEKAFEAQDQAGIRRILAGTP